MLHVHREVATTCALVAVCWRPDPPVGAEAVPLPVPSEPVLVLEPPIPPVVVPALPDPDPYPTVSLLMPAPPIVEPPGLPPANQKQYLKLQSPDMMSDGKHRLKQHNLLEEDPIL